MPEQQDVLNKKLNAFIGHGHDDQTTQFILTTMDAPQEITGEVLSPASESEAPDLAAI